MKVEYHLILQDGLLATAVYDSQIPRPWMLARPAWPAAASARAQPVLSGAAPGATVTWFLPPERRLGISHENGMRTTATRVSVDRMSSPDFAG